MKTFKLRFYLVLTLTAALLCFGTSANSALLGLDPDYPDLLANSQATYSYDASEELFIIDATPNKLSYSSEDLDFDYIYESTDHGFEYTAMINVDNSGAFKSTGTDNSLYISGLVDIDSTVYDGVLLTGAITDFGWGDPINIGNDQYQIFDFTFTVTGGLLADLFNGVNAPGGAISVSEDSGFGEDGWEVDFSGEFVKVDNFPVPVPAAIWLFGSSLLGLAGLQPLRKIINR